VRPSRDHSGFCGTARYASIDSHNAQDLVRRDDLWSLFCMLVEFANGQLPWRRVKDKDHVGEMKSRMTSEELIELLPACFGVMMKHLCELSYEGRPDYEMLIETLQRTYTELGGTENTPFDWEVARSPGEPGAS
jgi:tau tubulin kinase